MNLKIKNGKKMSNYTDKNIKIYVTICDEYLWLLKPFYYLFNKYWGDEKEVNILGYKKPDFDLPQNFKFISLGRDNGPDEWSTGLYNFFTNIEEEHFIFIHEDSFFVDPVNFKTLNTLLTYTDNQKVGRICLTRDTVNRNHELFDKKGDLTIVEATQDVGFRISTEASVWKRSYFLKYMIPHISAWDFEKNGSESAKRDGYHILTTKNENGPPDDAPLSLSNAMWRGNGLNVGKTNYPHLGFKAHLDFSVIKEMKEKNIVSEDKKFGIVYERDWKWFDEEGNLE
tara:strand:+ start:1000 stop:1851 length:852 start_codon:yes stop_codon:yes gene_type:complete